MTAKKTTDSLSSREDDYSDMLDQPDVSLVERPGASEPYEKVFQRRLARRQFLKGSAGVAAGVAVGGALVPEEADAFGWGWWRRRFSRRDDTLRFSPIDGSNADRIIVPYGYTQDIVIRWGDSINRHYPNLDTDEIENGALLAPGAGEAQANQFGYNCDAVEFFPLIPRTGISSTGFVCCNHEYTQPEMKYPGWPLFGEQILDPDSNEIRPATSEETAARIRDFVIEHPEAVKVELAAHGISVVRVRRRRGRWSYRRGSRFNRRITAETPIEISGPAAGHPLLQTHGDPTGTVVKGTLNNCAGGQTPWGTYLSAEENVDQYFGNFTAFAERASTDEEFNVLDAHARLPLPRGQSNRGWEYVETRFDIDVEPKEALRFGWVVELDPYNPHAPAKKRTAIGRFKHECATTILAKDNRCVVYSGDDARMEYVFKFVSKDSYDPHAPRSKAMELLDEGTLYAARFDDDGNGEWLPLIFGNGPLTPENGFDSQAEVLIKARKAADLLGATPMDRPEDVEANPKSKKVYIALTNNTRRQNTDAAGTRIFQGREVNTFPAPANPRGPNRFGHIMEITEAGDDNAAEHFTWEIFLLAGDPETTVGNYFTNIDDVTANINIANNTAPGQEDVYYAGWDDPSEVAPIGSPDNISFDNDGNLWIITDGSQPRGTNNGGFAVPTEGPNRGKLRQFMSGPIDCEVCGGEFTPDNRTLFLNIQHPGGRFASFGNPTLEEPSSFWPDSSVDGGSKKQPRPSLVAIKNGRYGWGRVGE